MSVKFETVRDALYDWAHDVINDNDIPIIFMRPNERRPSNFEDPQVTPEMITLNFTGPLNKIGSDSLQFNSGTTYDIVGQRTANISVMSYGPNAEQLMISLQNSLEKPTVLAGLRANGIAIWNEPNILDLSAELDAGFENRAGMDLLLGIGSSIVDDVGIIESIESTGSFNDGDVVQQIDISV